MSRPPYRIIEHTADIGIEVFASTLGDLFSNAAFALSDQITDASRLEKKLSRSIELRAGRMDELLHLWLSELVYLFDTQHWVSKTAEILEISATHVKAVVWGEPFDPSRHERRYEIKAVTLHGLEVKQENGGWRARVLFDI
ncbi:MAG: archease [Pseudomonadota bacterium]